MNTVSVIVPVYNTEEFLPECINSILDQTHRDIELICIDDASTDGSLDVLRAYADRDCRINIIAAEQHGNAATARNLGIEQASGEYICFVDSDDWIDADYIKTMVEAAIDSKADITMNTNVLWEDGGKCEPHKITQFEDDEKPRFLERADALEKTVTMLLYRLYRHDFFDRHRLRVPDVEGGTEDMAFHYISLLHAKNVYMHRGAAYHHRGRPGSLTQIAKKQDRQDIFVAKAYTAVVDYCTKHCPSRLKELKLFRVMPSYSINTEEKFDAFKQLFGKLLQAGIIPEKPMYNDLDTYFFNAVVEADTYEKYRKRYGANVLMNFIKYQKSAR